MPLKGGQVIFITVQRGVVYKIRCDVEISSRLELLSILSEPSLDSWPPQLLVSRVGCSLVRGSQVAASVYSAKSR